MKTRKELVVGFCVIVFCSVTWAAYPVVRPSRKIPAPEAGRYTIYPDREKQVVWGLGFEIQSDSIASGNEGLPEATTSVPHDLTPAERQRFYRDMLAGFRYCRLAGGLYWRGTDPEGKYLQPRWPEQLDELKEMMDVAGIEGLSLEYWSTAPFWKANRKYTGRDGSENILRCYGKDFANDPDYHGDVETFLKDFAQANVRDIETLEQAGFKISMWGLSNEPWVDSPYSSCKYTKSEYGQVFKAVAPAIRAHDAKITIIADTMWGWPQYIAPVMKEPDYAHYVDALVVHAIGDNSNQVIHNFEKTRANIAQELPLFQNEYEYLQGPASRDRCHNTVQNIMNWYQLAESPTWFWIHALKPFQNAEASGYSLGFWMPTDPDYAKSHKVKSASALGCLRTSDQFTISEFPPELMGLFYVTINRGNWKAPAPAYSFRIDKKARVYLAVQDRGYPNLPGGWKRADMKLTWKDRFTDTVYVKTFNPGVVQIPGHHGRDDQGYYGIPHMAFVEDISGETVVLRVSDLPTALGGKTGTVETQKDSPAASLAPGHWTYNEYNWHSVVGFLKHMPWDSRVVELKEDQFDDDMRILAYKRPDGKLVLVLSNRCFKDYTFQLDTGLTGAVFKGVRYTPEGVGIGFCGVPVGTRQGAAFDVTVPDLTWEFWIQQ